MPEMAETSQRLRCTRRAVAYWLQTTLGMNRDIVESLAQLLLVPNRHAARPRIRCSQSHPGLRVDHYPFSVSHVARLLGEDVSLPFKRNPSVAVYAQRLELDSIRHPLMMKARCIDRLLNVHSEVHHVHDHLQHGVD